MENVLIKYRTSDNAYNQHAVVPRMWVSDLLHWLTLSENATIVSVTDNCDCGLILPVGWPSYQTCLDYDNIVSVLNSTR